jgi:MFS transporter, PAT family, beta-lactamase induction signal transducer AmpG
MFQFAAALGLIAVLFCALEWIRLTLETRKAAKSISA